MKKKNENETRIFWNRIAENWDIQVGEDGDSNRMMNSDPVLWAFAGNVAGLTVLDAGCGTGYLSRKLHKKQAKVIGIDISEEMIEISRNKSPQIDYRVDSCSELKTIESDSIDLVIANYVIMDTPNLEATIEHFFRVLKSKACAVLIFSHPCFPQSRGRMTEDGVTYEWDFPYFAQVKNIDPAWGHFTSEFIWFHRPLSVYWKAFMGAGFNVIDMEEPRVTQDRHHLAVNQHKLNNSISRPYSIAFKLQKP